MTPNDIGPILAYIVSNIENEEYIYSELSTIKTEPKVVHNSQMGIVKNDFQNCTFYLDQNCPWFHEKLATFFQNQAIDNKNNEYELEYNPFPYLNIFIRIIRTADEITPEYLHQTANYFITCMNNLKTSDQKLLKKIM